MSKSEGDDFRRNGSSFVSSTHLREGLATFDNQSGGQAGRRLRGEDLHEWRREGIHQAVQNVRVLRIVQLKRERAIEVAALSFLQ